MNSPATIALLTLLASTAAAQQYIPSQEEKVAALKEAYRLNNNSMVSGTMVDLTAPRAVKTDRIVPTVDPNEVNAIDQQATVKVAQATDVCTRHHMHKVIRGSSWRCKR